MRTNSPSNTAFRGFGVPQGMFGIESVLTRIAAYLDLAPEIVREKNIFRPGDVVPLGPINKAGDPHVVESPYNLNVMVDQIRRTSEFKQRRAAVNEFNNKHKFKKRGLALIPTGKIFSIQTPSLHLYQIKIHKSLLYWI